VVLKSQWGKSSAALVANSSNIDVATAVLLLKPHPGFAPIAVKSYIGDQNCQQSFQLKEL
jgi:hypothetical protein